MLYNVTLCNYEEICNSCTLYIIILILAFIIIIDVDSIYFYFYWHTVKNAIIIVIEDIG